MNDLLHQYWNIAILGLMAFFGAIVHATSQWKLARDKDTAFTAIDFFILWIIAMFAGLIFGLVASLAFENEIMRYLAVGTGSFLGVQGLNKISETLLTALTDRLKK